MLEVQISRNNGTIDFNFEEIKEALTAELERLQEFGLHGRHKSGCKEDSGRA